MNKCRQKEENLKLISKMNENQQRRWKVSDHLIIWISIRQQFPGSHVRKMFPKNLLIGLNSEIDILRKKPKLYQHVPMLVPTLVT